MLEGNESAQLLEDDRLLVHEAVLAACDASDGVTDRVVGDPERCDFDPGSLLCEGENTTTCLTAAQVETARMLYSSPKNPKSGREITGLLPGSETNWTDLGWTQSARNTGVEQFKYLIDEDPEWTIDRFDFDRDIVRAEEIRCTYGDGRMGGRRSSARQHSGFSHSRWGCRPHPSALSVSSVGCL